MRISTPPAKQTNIYWNHEQIDWQVLPIPAPDVSAAKENITCVGQTLSDTPFLQNNLGASLGPAHTGNGLTRGVTGWGGLVVLVLVRVELVQVLVLIPVLLLPH